MKTHWAAIIGAFISIIAGVLAFYLQIANRQFETEAMPNEVTRYESRNINANLKNELIAEIRKELVSQSSNENPTIVTEKLASLNKRIDEVDSKTLALRQAINPINPNEIITIARLTDEVKSIRSDFSKVQKQIEGKQQSFESSVLREIKSSSDSTTLILVVLLPLVLNFLYTLWKDIRTANANNDS